jgi:hypothetical protein
MYLVFFVIFDFFIRTEIRKQKLGIIIIKDYVRLFNIYHRNLCDYTQLFYY